MVTFSDIEQSFNKYDGEQGLIGIEAALGLTASGNVSQRVDSVVAEVTCKIAKWEKMRPLPLLRDHAIFASLFTAIDRADMYAMTHHADGLGSFGDRGIAWPDCWWGRLASRLEKSGLAARLWEQIHRETHAQMAQPTIKEERSASGKKAADARHDKPTGSRDKHEKIRAAWASGHYTSRDRCAEEECAGLDMSLSAARRALRNTPDPA